jgi:hypothetical protein
MSERELTAEERKAARRVERAIKALPETIGLYFHGTDATVMDWTEGNPIDAQTPHDRALGLSIETPRCPAGDF